MNRPQTITRPHLDHSVKPIDARAHMTPELLLEDCYSVGFRISTISQDSFVHAMIIADSLERLQYGIQQEVEILLSTPSEQPILDIDVVYLRSMQTLNRDYLPQNTWDDIESECKGYLKRRDDDHFVMCAEVNDFEYTVQNMHTKNAMNVILTTKFKRVRTPSHKFYVFMVLQAHPATAWFESSFHEAARRIKSIKDRHPNRAERLH